MKATERQLKLLKVVKFYHKDQFRKYSGDPYNNHLKRVAAIVASINPEDELLVEVALCHDLFEDTICDNELLVAELKQIGYEPLEILFITRGVLSLTDVWTHQSHPNWNRATRKAWEANRLGKIYEGYQTVKYADLIDNSISILIEDPGFAKVYVKEVREVIKHMRKGDLNLLFALWTILNQYENKIK